MPRSLAALLALVLPLTAATLLAEPAPATAAEPVKAGSTAGSTSGYESASEAKAFGMARESGKPVEIIDRRTEYSETYANPDGSLRQKQFTLPVWSRHESVWHRTDATVTKREDGTIGPTAAFGITFSSGGDGPLVAMDKSGRKLALTWPGTLPEPVLEENTALYKAVLPGVDLKLIAEVNGFAQHLIVTTPEAAANPALKSIKLGITADGVTLDDTAADQLLAKDPAGNVVFSAPQPKMWEQPPVDETEPAPTPVAKSATAMNTLAAGDAEETPRDAPVGADVTGSTLTLTPDPALLATATQFPLVIDPVFSGGQRATWAVVYSAEEYAEFPEGSGWKSSNPADEPRIGFNGTGDTRSFFAMDISGLKGATVSNVTFAVEQTHSWGCDASAAGPTELWTSKDITNTPNYSNSDDYFVTKVAEKKFAHGNPTYCPGVEGADFTSSALTSYVQDGANHGWSRLTFGMKVPDSYKNNVNSFKRIRNNPVLQLDYNTKPQVTGGGAFEGYWSQSGDGNKPVPCGGMIANSGLVMTATLYDKDGGTVTPEFVVTNASGATVPVNGAAKVVSGKTAWGKVLSEPLDTGTYRWKVRAKDEEGTVSPFTDECSFSFDEDGPAGGVKVTTADGKELKPIIHPARTTLRIKVQHTATDLAGFCWIVDLPMSVSGTRCSHANWVPVPSGATEAFIDIVPANEPTSILHVLAYDKAGNHSPADGAQDTTTINTSKSAFVYAPGKNPKTPGDYPHDLLGDLNGDGYVDMHAIDSEGKLRFYAGDGTGRVKDAQTVGMSGWSGALLAHGGDFTNFNSPTLAPDGYEDLLALLPDKKLYLYAGNGQGGTRFGTRESLAPPSDLLTEDKGGAYQGWGRVLQMIAPGDMDQRTDEDLVKGNDLVLRECIDDACSEARLRLYPGITSWGNGSDQHREPFDFGKGIIIGSSNWTNYTILSTGDQNGDGLLDIVARNGVDGNLYLYPGKMTNGIYKLETRSLYGNGGWQTGNRPLLTAAGNAQGTVVTKTYLSDGDSIPYKAFQPKAGDEAGDLWATTPKDPDHIVRYTDSTGAAATTTCPSGCLLFYPGSPTSNKSPSLVGTGGWSTTITGIF